MRCLNKNSVHPIAAGIALFAAGNGCIVVGGFCSILIVLILLFSQRYISVPRKQVFLSCPVKILLKMLAGCW